MNKEIYYKIKNIENRLNFLKSTSCDNIFYHVLPSTYTPKAIWQDLLTYYNYSEVEELLSKGVVPLSRELLTEKTITDIFEPIVASDCSHLLLDTNYGMVVFPKGNKPKNMYLDMFELERYRLHNPILQDSPSDIFSIGALRGSIIYETEHLHFTPIEIEVQSREDIENIILKINTKIQTNGSRFQVWFRGQTNDYRLSTISSDSYDYCPWRNLTDISLVPSLYRNPKDIVENLSQYEKNLNEILQYELGLSAHLKMPLYDSVKEPTKDFTEYFKDSVWEDSNTPFYWSHSDQDGNFVERHDYNPVFRALQTSLFLQHYGIPTNILDITSDLDIALFFAQNWLDNGVYKPTSNSDGGVIYIFLLDPVTDRFINSAEILQEFNVQRPIRQKCGVIAGASYSTQNYYSRFISIKLKLKNHINYNHLYTSEYIFPQEDQDTVLEFLNNHSKQFNLQEVKPM